MWDWRLKAFFRKGIGVVDNEGDRRLVVYYVMECFCLDYSVELSFLSGIFVSWSNLCGVVYLSWIGIELISKSQSMAVK